MEHKNVPTIRFKGFQNEWDLRILGEIGYTYTGLSGKTKEDFGFGDGRFVTYMNVFSNVLSDIRKIEKVQIDKTQNLVKYGDVLFTTSSETPEEVGMSSVWLHKIDNIYLNSFCFGYRPTFNLNHHYLAYYLRSSSFRKKIIPLAQGISRYNISKGKVMDIFISIPLDNEQTQIGNFFKTFDEQISLQEQKHQKLINLKKAMLEKMFPKEGADVPEIRFKGFTERWNYVELGEVVTERKIIQKISIDAPILAFAAGQGVIDRSQRKSNNRDHLTKDESNKKYLLTEFNDIVYNPSNLKYGAIDRNKHGRGVISPIYVTFTTEQIPSFIELIVKGENFKIKALQYEEGTVVKRQSVKPENLLSLKIFVSPSLSEQQKIGDYFENLDQLIQQSQTQLDKFKNIKQALLQKMFV